MLDRFYRSLKDLRDIEVSSESVSEEIMECLLDDLNIRIYSITIHVLIFIMILKFGDLNSNYKN